MATIFESTITAYKLACLEFIKQYKTFIHSHISVMDTGHFMYHSEDIEKPFKYLSDVLHYAVVIYDTIEKEIISAEDKKYMSGIKCIDNMTKHQGEYKDYTLDNFVKPIPEISTQIDQVINEEDVIVSFHMSLKFIFQDISNIESRYEEQKRNYMENICGKEANEVISKIDKILKKYIDLGKIPQ